MPAISASAPGKVILFGEHAVVYGQPAIAVPISQLRARAIVKAEPRADANQVRVQAPDIGLDADLTSLARDHPLRVAISGVRSALNIDLIPACTVRVSSNIPVSSGLGSSAAVSVAVIRAVTTFLGRPLSEDRVADLAFEVEKIHHGTPSGIDNTVVSFERPVYFELGRPPEALKIARPITIVIADSGIPSPTATTVAEVRRAWQADPTPFERLFGEIGSLVRKARAAIEGGAVDQLGLLMDSNHDLLKDLGVSSEFLDQLTDAARASGALGAKLSGGGRGGNVIGLVAPHLSESVIQSLHTAGAKSTYLTTISPTES